MERRPIKVAAVALAVLRPGFETLG
jgi:hypothetical protein